MWFASSTAWAGLPAPDSVLRDAALLVAGWGLGILSSPITDLIRRRSAKHRLTRALRTELRSLQDSLACVVIQLARRRGVLTRPLLEALMSMLKTSGHVADRSRAIRTIEGLLEPDVLPSAAAPALDPAPDPRAPLTLGVYGVPFLDAHFHRLDLYSLETQRMLVELHAALVIYNQHADEAMNYHQMTFATGGGPERLSALAVNVETCYERAAEKASDLVSRIAALLQEPEMRNA
jgi:hypothetical protein